LNAILKAIWTDDFDVSDAAVVATLLDEHGMNAASLLDAAAGERVGRPMRRTRTQGMDACGS
jgi:2-hydroxychromene-2-carboxylate isomerase